MQEDVENLLNETLMSIWHLSNDYHFQNTSRRIRGGVGSSYLEQKLTWEFAAQSPSPAVGAMIEQRVERSTQEATKKCRLGEEKRQSHLRRQCLWSYVDGFSARPKQPVMRTLFDDGATTETGSGEEEREKAEL